MRSYVECSVELLGYTDRAIKVELDTEDEVWIPRSCLDPDRNYTDEDFDNWLGTHNIEIRVEEEFARKNNLL